MSMKREDTTALRFFFFNGIWLVGLIISLNYKPILLLATDLHATRILCCILAIVVVILLRFFHSLCFKRMFVRDLLAGVCWC